MGLSKKPDIEELKRRSDVKGLVKALGDEDGTVRGDAADALGKIGDTRAVESLIIALGEARGVVYRVSAISWMLVGVECGEVGREVAEVR